MPTFNPATFLLTILTLILSITVHEWAHAATADAIRDGLVAAGVLVEDTPGGARWSLARPGQEGD